MFGELLKTLFGPGTWGTGGNLVADAFTDTPAVIALIWHHRRALAAMERRLTGGSGRELPARARPRPRAAAGPPPPPTSANTNGDRWDGGPLNGGSYR